MTNHGSKKTNAPEATELHDEELARVAGGNNTLNTTMEAEYNYSCMYCGAIYNVADPTCPNCGQTTVSVGAIAEG